MQMSFFCQMINTRWWYYEIYILLIKISRALFFLFSSFKNRVNSWIQILSHFLYFFARKNQIQWRKVMIPYCNIIVSLYLDCKKLYSHERNLLFIFYIIISSYEVPINAAPKYDANICFFPFSVERQYFYWWNISGTYNYFSLLLSIFSFTWY